MGGPSSIRSLSVSDRSIEGARRGFRALFQARSDDGRLQAFGHYIPGDQAGILCCTHTHAERQLRSLISSLSPYEARTLRTRTGGRERGAAWNATWLAGVQRLAAQVNWHGEGTEQRWADWRAWLGRASWIGAANRISAVAQRRLQPLHLAPSFGLARLATVTHSLLVTSLLLSFSDQHDPSATLSSAFRLSRSVGGSRNSSSEPASVFQSRESIYLARRGLSEKICIYPLAASRKPAMTNSATAGDVERLTAQMSLSDSQLPSSNGVAPLPPQAATGGPPSRASPSLRPNQATGGPSAARPANTAVGAAERARQMAGARLPPSLQAKLAANANRSAHSPSPNHAVLGHDQRIDSSASASLFVSAAARPGASPGTGMGGLAARRGIPGTLGAPSPGSPSATPGAGMGARRNRPGLKLSDMGVGAGDGLDTGSAPRSGMGAGTGRRAPPPGRLPDTTDASKGSDGTAQQNGAMSTPFSNFSKIVDPSGRLNFSGKAVLHASGVEFGNGTSFKINMAELELLDELGKGNYGTVRKVRHTQTHVEMAMKEIRLELDESKLNAIIMELDILHRATAPQIVEFYGAFFIESCVYYCMEYMNAGSLDKLYGERGSVPEDVLARITGSMVRGLSFLKDQLQIMHRDVKPTNVLINQKGQVKLCDFGVSGQLEKSLAKTNIGCQSYMAPERIKGESQNMLGTYTVASDVWSLGLSMVETTQGTYPYPPETYSNVFAQLQAIVHGDPPELPAELYSETARDFVAKCLEKVPSRRPTYAQLLQHDFLVQDAAKGEEGVDMVGWVARAIAARAHKKEQAQANGVASPPGSSAALPQ
ncbi:hypothetical protein PaG_06209 [Moesziomyces aphidis]|uniref:mitogen-activated protein kinase kinase n=1 Tax=Moesziomyces aphidis TaxID=84754 RepID=W3VGG1_MOEAP|nr:hypothetical protein PaG_06209 [Moesziomyces aphidis]